MFAEAPTRLAGSLSSYRVLSLDLAICPGARLLDDNASPQHRLGRCGTDAEVIHGL